MNQQTKHKSTLQCSQDEGGESGATGHCCRPLWEGFLSDLNLCTHSHIDSSRSVWVTWLVWLWSDWWICIHKRCWLCCWCWSWFWWKHHKLGDGWLFSSPMSYYVHSFDISHCRRLFEALQCCTIAICCNFAHLRCEGDTRVVEEAIVLKGKVAPAENKNKII